MRTFRRLRQLFVIVTRVAVLVVQLHRWLQQTETGRRVERRALRELRRAAAVLSSRIPGGAGRRTGRRTGRRPAPAPTSDEG